MIAMIASLLLIVAVAFALANAPKVQGKLSYPRSFENEVLFSSREYGLDPNLVFAVIKTESSFQPDVVSRAGAMGLMQVLPTTAEWIAWRRGFSYDSERILEPAYNIDLGCYLLSYLLEHYDSDLTLAVAAYNAGVGNVDKWLNSDEYYDGKKLSIPFSETRNYVEKVLDSYEKYKAQHP